MSLKNWSFRRFESLKKINGFFRMMFVFVFFLFGLGTGVSWEKKNIKQILNFQKESSKNISGVDGNGDSNGDSNSLKARELDGNIQLSSKSGQSESLDPLLQMANVNEWWDSNFEANAISFLKKFSLDAIGEKERRYLNYLENNQYLTLFNEPGLNWEICMGLVSEDQSKSGNKSRSQFCDEAVGWADRGTEIYVIGEGVEATTVDPETDEEIQVDYVPVVFRYKRKFIGKNGKEKIIEKRDFAFIEEDLLESSPAVPFYGDTDHQNRMPQSISEPISSIDEALGSNLRSEGTGQLRRPQAEDESDGIWSIVQKWGQAASSPALTRAKNGQRDVDSMATALGQYVGFCPIQNPWSRPQISASIPYDNLILNKMNGPYNKLISNYNVVDEFGKEISFAQMNAIDSMARTLYGEMGGCFKYGLQYPMVVARIILNRVESEEDHPVFIQGRHDSTKSLIAKVATTPSQFSMWLSRNQVPRRGIASSTRNKRKKFKSSRLKVRKVRASSGGHCGPLYQGLCPPRAIGEPFYRSAKAPLEEYQIWQNALKISTEAVMFTDQFKQKTQSLAKAKHYTSGMKNNPPAWARKMTLMNFTKNFSIGGRPISKTQCVEVWQERN